MRVGSVLHPCWVWLALLLLNPGHDIVDPEEHAGTLNGHLDDLKLDSHGLPDTDLGHISDLSVESIDTEVKTVAFGVLGSEGSEDSDDISAAVLGERPWDSLKSIGN